MFKKIAGSKKGGFPQIAGGIFAIVALFIAMPFSAHAALPDDDIISITPQQFTCGDQTVAFSGTVTYVSNLPHRIIVRLDGTEIDHFDNRPVNWTTVAVPVSVGSHTLSVEIWDTDANFNLLTLDDSQTWDFTIDACPTPTPTPTPTPAVGGGDDGDGPGDQGPGGDCCAHDDDVTPTPKPGKVLGATTKKPTPTPTPTPAPAVLGMRAPATGSTVPAIALVSLTTGIVAYVGRRLETRK